MSNELAFNASHFVPDVTPTNNIKYPKALTDLRVTLNSKDHGYEGAGSLTALKINRAACSGNFFMIMDSHEEAHDFATALFDNHGRIQAALLNDEYKKGLGTFGEELNRGNMVLITGIDVKEKFRNKGLGRLMLEKLVESEHIKQDDFLYVGPAPARDTHPATCDESVGENRRNQMYIEAQTKQDRFFRKNGFRRVGRSKFLAFSPNTAHLSHTIHPDADLDIPSKTDEGEEFQDQFGDTRAGQELRVQTFPIHFRIINDKSAAIKPYIIESYNRDVNSIRAPDDMGVTPVYAAALSSNKNALETLLALGVADQLQSRANADRQTPLEACEQSLFRRRSFLQTYGLEGLSFEEGEVEKLQLMCVAKLKRAVGMPEMNGITDEQYVERKRTPV